ncbi:MAG: chemotaxis protein CheD [Clostridiales bacterium]|jgi:chemotaxis protein CheD|uniref:chemotaxis protein CheD n=1 Tax=Aminipila sp. TaxID=2060095 RepID=UPI001D8B0506|nr:chemotaxis protein CheD [Aminipila sp.]MBE6033230.1 chemotaxis protein CheD [Clostridiales bacterium]
MSNIATVGIAEMGVVKGDDKLITYALGSCVGVCIYDKSLKIAGMVHIMLPAVPADGSGKSICRYADSGIPALIKKMESIGSNRRGMTAKIAGGARMFNIPGDSVVGNIGDRNIEAVKKTLAGLSIPIIGQDVGQDYARTMSFHAEDGMVTIKAFSKGTSTW